MRCLDLFAGAGGWDVAARELGVDSLGVEIMPEARATREANGLNTSAISDVWQMAEHLSREDFSYYDGLIASPPCQTFSMAGKGAGREALDYVLSQIDHKVYETVMGLRNCVKMFDLDERTALVLVPLLFWHHMRPRWVAFEQVPTVLPVWEAMAEVMREAGYSVWTGNLHAEQFGVPQTRKRSILMARRDGASVVAPRATHSKYYPRDKTRLDPGVKPWVSMAQALGWDGSMGDVLASNGTVRDCSDPSPTLTGSMDNGNFRLVQDRQLGKGRLERHGKPKDRTTDEPSYSMRGQASGSAPGGGYVLSQKFAGAGQTAIDTAGQIPREMEEPAHTVTGKATATWVQPTRRVTLEEAAILQGFPRDFVFCGSKGKQYLQVGNAIPPPLAKAILQSLTSSGSVDA